MVDFYVVGFSTFCLVWCFDVANRVIGRASGPSKLVLHHQRFLFMIRRRTRTEGPTKVQLENGR